MKSGLPAMMLGLGLSTLPVNSAGADTVIPGNVVSCYRAVYNDIVTGNINNASAQVYINPENILRSMRNPITPELEQAVIDSALRFARFLQRRIQSEGGNFTSGDVRFTRYREARSGTILHGVVGGTYNFRMILEPGGECHILDFTVEGIRGMRDDIPRV